MLGNHILSSVFTHTNGEFHVPGWVWIKNCPVAEIMIVQRYSQISIPAMLANGFKEHEWFANCSTIYDGKQDVEATN